MDPWLPQTWRTAPLVVGVRLEEAGDAQRALAALTIRHPGTRFVTIVAAADETALGWVLDGLGPVLAEVVFTSGAGLLAVDALTDLAFGRHGLGQDFVFQAEEMADAVDVAVAAMAGDPPARWEGTAVFVAGTLDVVDTARAALPPEAPSRHA